MKPDRSNGTKPKQTSPGVQDHASKYLWVTWLIYDGHTISAKWLIANRIIHRYTRHHAENKAVSGLIGIERNP